jgi:hypothetical protein
MQKLTENGYRGAWRAKEVSADLITTSREDGTRRRRSQQNGRRQVSERPREDE